MDRIRERTRPAPSGAGFLLPACTMLLMAPLSFASAQVAAPSAYLQKLDTDRSGNVSLAEYQHWMGYAFERMDRDGDGVLAPHELPGGRGRPVTRADHQATLAAAFARQDADRNGTLDAAVLAAPPR